MLTQVCRIICRVIFSLKMLVIRVLDGGGIRGKFRTQIRIEKQRTGGRMQMCVKYCISRP